MSKGLITEIIPASFDIRYKITKYCFQTRSREQYAYSNGLDTLQMEHLFHRFITPNGLRTRRNLVPGTWDWNQKLVK